MEEGVFLKPIAHIETDYKEKFGIPRQSGLAKDLLGKVVFTREFRSLEAVRGLEGFSHIWLIWEFSKNVREKFSPTVRPPRLGGNRRLGVFATRSPFRPNPIGLSCVRLVKIDEKGENAPVLWVSGADILDGTPIFDIKPYLPEADSVPGASGGFAEEAERKTLAVDFPGNLLEKVPAALRDGLLEVLSLDPRPAYHDDPKRVYGFNFAGMNIKFSVDSGRLFVIEVDA